MSTSHHESQQANLSPRTWDRHAIVAAVRRNGLSLRALAEQNGLSKQACSVALVMPVPAADRAIAKCIGVPLHELWPDRYDAKGNRLGLMRRSTAVKKPAKRKKG
jgi:Ner family transcriptional regulator